MGRIHRSVAGSLCPVRMIRPLYWTWHAVSVKVTMQPCLQRTLIPIREATDKLGTTWPVRTVGRPLILTS